MVVKVDDPAASGSVEEDSMTGETGSQRDRGEHWQVYRETGETQRQWSTIFFGELFPNRRQRQAGETKDGAGDIGRPARPRDSDLLFFVNCLLTGDKDYPTRQRTAPATQGDRAESLAVDKDEGHRVFFGELFADRRDRAESSAVDRGDGSTQLCNFLICLFFLWANLFHFFVWFVSFFIVKSSVKYELNLNHWILIQWIGLKVLTLIVVLT